MSLDMSVSEWDTFDKHCDWSAFTTVKRARAETNITDERALAMLAVAAALHQVAGLTRMNGVNLEQRLDRIIELLERQ